MVLAYKKILLKLSGEALCEKDKKGLSYTASKQMAQKISKLIALGVQLGIVIGGGNLFRGKSFPSIARVKADSIGMLATVINAGVLKEALASVGVKAIVLSAAGFDGVAEKYSFDNACRFFQEGYTVIFAGGTGNPYFSTDTAAALRSCEMGADVLLKGTKVDGVYDKDPVEFSDAVKYDFLSYSQLLEKRLQVMDQTAVALCQDCGIKILVVDIFKEGALEKVALGEKIGTLVSGEC
jgi:uridylate kinase